MSDRIRLTITVERGGDGWLAKCLETGTRYREPRQAIAVWGLFRDLERDLSEFRLGRQPIPQRNCGTCRRWELWPPQFNLPNEGECLMDDESWPADGYCHRWVAKETSK